MMTDIDEKFLEFSQLMDENESVDTAELHDDGRLLLDLRKTLRTEDGLPSGSAGDMASRVKEASASLKGGAKWGHELRGALWGSALSGRGASYIALVFALIAGCWYVSVSLVVGLGSLLLLGLVVWLGNDWKNPDFDLPGLQGIGFYALPMLAVALTGALAGLAVAGLGSVSATFRGADGTLAGLGSAAGVGIFALLLLALMPSWRALRDNHSQNRLRMFAHVAFYGAWLVALGLGIQTLLSPNNALVIGPVQSAGVGFFVFCALAVWLSPYHPRGELDLKAARRRTRRSLMLSLLPIGICVVAFYQIHLTRDLHNRGRYETVIAEVQDWYESQMQIPDEQNGWMDVRAFMMIRDMDSGTAAKLGGLKTFVDEYPKTNQRDELWGSAEWKAARSEFLSELPLIETVLGKPSFSHLPTEAKDGLNFNNLVPNYILLRSISEGLGLLTWEAMEERDAQSAVDYSILGLKWASLGEPDILISLMIRISMMEIALEPLRELILSQALTDAQLVELGEALKQSRPNELFMYEVMTREIYMVDKMMRELKNKEFAEIQDYGEISDSAGVKVLLNALPESYIESERLAYLNFALERVERWKQLSAPPTGEFEQINPLNLASQVFVPNTSRAQQRFMYALSQVDAHRVMIALERYRLANGFYPNRLEEVVPKYLDALPADMMNEAVVGRKAGFEYKKIGERYELISESKCYEVEDTTHMIYGPRK